MKNKDLVKKDLNSLKSIMGMLKNKSLIQSILKLVNDYNIKIEDSTLRKIADIANGDVRTALNGLEVAVLTTNMEADGYIHITDEVINVLKRLGCIVKVTSDEILMQSPVLLKSINEEVDTYPSFPTDLQPILSTVLLKANGESIVKDNVYKKRISHIKELNKLSGNIFYENETIYINKSHITNGECISHDLRCGFALICAGVMSDDFIKIKNAENILRGYEDIINKLTSVGVTIKQIL